jgi:hypothetical protein
VKFRVDLFFEEMFKHFTNPLPFAGPNTGDLLATASTKMSLQEFEAPSGFRYVFKAVDRQAEGRKRCNLAL